MKRSTFRRRQAVASNAAYHARKEAERRAWAAGRARKPTPADMARLRDSRAQQQAKADRRSACWTGARA